MHYLIKKAVKEIALLRNEEYNKTVEKYHQKNSELEKEKKQHIKEVMDINEQLGGNDKKIFEAIQKL